MGKETLLWNYVKHFLCFNHVRCHAVFSCSSFFCRSIYIVYIIYMLKYFRCYAKTKYWNYFWGWGLSELVGKLLLTHMCKLSWGLLVRRHPIVVSQLWKWSGRREIIDEERKSKQLDLVLARSRGDGILSMREGFILSWEHRQLIHNNRSDGKDFWHRCYCVGPCG